MPEILSAQNRKLNYIPTTILTLTYTPTILILYFFFLGEHPPDATEAFQLLPRRHLSLHHNGKDCLATETGAVEQTPVMWS